MCGVVLFDLASFLFGAQMASERFGFQPGPSPDAGLQASDPRLARRGSLTRALEDVWTHPALGIGQPAGALVANLGKSFRLIAIR